MCVWERERRSRPRTTTDALNIEMQTNVVWCQAASKGLASLSSRGFVRNSQGVEIFYICVISFSMQLELSTITKRRFPRSFQMRCIVVQFFTRLNNPDR